MSLLKLTTALTGVTRLAFDTAPIIYFVERNPKYVDIMRDVFRRVDSGAITGFSSTVTLTEVLTLPKRLGNMTVEVEYRNLLLWSRNFTLLPVDTAVAERAADLRARHGLRTPDALQVAMAAVAGCEAFLTNDAGLRRVSDVQVLLLDELEL